LGVVLTQDDRLLRPGINVACIQFEPIFGQPAKNLISMETKIRAAHVQGATVVVLPELADSGYVFADAAELARLAQPIPGGESAQRLIALARELQIYIVSGLAERDGERFYNAAVICGPQGYIGTYRKLHLWNEENRFFQEGDLGLPVFDTPIGKIGVAICYDGWFPETFRQLTLKGAELVCVPTNWVPVAGNDRHAETMAHILHKAGAHSNGIFIACADRVGIERGQPFLGRSLIVGPQGWPLAGPASDTEEETLIATVSLDDIAKAREINVFNHVLASRRADVYG
jgi:N-carbamoylputrescine amidase